MSSQQISSEIKRFTSSKQELVNAGYTFSGLGFITISGKNSDPGVLAVDCEMCDTRDSYGRTKKSVVSVSVVDHQLKTVYNQIVKPKGAIVDYNTGVHGITKREIQSGISLDQVHNYFERHFYSNTILVGHSLEHDFQALELIHETVADVALVYRHPYGPSTKYTLKDLAKQHLGENIQVGNHSSAEDARACMKLMLKKIGR